MNLMQSIWEQFSPVERIFWFIALVFTILSLIQIVLMIRERAEDLETEMENTVFPDRFQAWASFRRITAFFVAFGWGGLLSLYLDVPVLKSLMIAILCGIGYMMVWVYISMKMEDLRRSGTIQLLPLIGKVGVVQRGIPSSGQGTGIIQIQQNRKVRRLMAFSDGNQIPAGRQVVINQIVEKDTVRVTEVG